LESIGNPDLAPSIASISVSTSCATAGSSTAGTSAVISGTTSSQKPDRSLRSAWSNDV
jgi:hypothetical protein